MAIPGNGDRNGYRQAESRVASVGHWRPELLAMRGRPFWELLYGGCRETRSGTRDLGPEIWEPRSELCTRIFLKTYVFF